MIRTQISLTSEQMEALRNLAVERGVSMAALLREAVDKLVAQQQDQKKVERALAAVGRYHSGLGDIAEEHDRYLDEAYGDR